MIILFVLLFLAVVCGFLSRTVSDKVYRESLLLGSWVLAVGAVIVIVVTLIGYNDVLAVAEEYQTKQEYVGYCNGLSLSLAQDYPQSAEFRSGIVLQDSQNAWATQEAIKTARQCLEEQKLQAEREAQLNKVANNPLNWPIRVVYRNMRDRALGTAEER